MEAAELFFFCSCAANIEEISSHPLSLLRRETASTPFSLESHNARNVISVILIDVVMKRVLIAPQGI